VLVLLLSAIAWAGPMLIGDRPLGQGVEVRQQTQVTVQAHVVDGPGEVERAVHIHLTESDRLRVLEVERGAPSQLWLHVQRAAGHKRVADHSDPLGHHLSGQRYLMALSGGEWVLTDGKGEAISFAERDALSAAGGARYGIRPLGFLSGTRAHAGDVLPLDLHGLLLLEAWLPGLDLHSGGLVYDGVVRRKGRDEAQFSVHAEGDAVLTEVRGAAQLTGVLHVDPASGWILGFSLDGQLAPLEEGTGSLSGQFQVSSEITYGGTFKNR